MNLKKQFDSQGKEAIKKELGVKEDIHFIYVGRLLDDKQVDLIIKSFRSIHKKYDCRITIVGDGPEKENLKQLVKEYNISNIHFTGGIYDPETVGKWIYISDLFVMPGRLGNSVVHSFCYGTPVLSQKKDYFYHGEGIGYMENGINGFLADDDDIAGMTQIMTELIHNKDLRNSLRIKAYQTVNNKCSIDHMIKGIEDAVTFCLKR